MANKRDLKKFIRNTCGALAAEIVLARAAFPEIPRREVHDIVSDIARMQCTSLAKVGISFDKTPGDFATVAEYHKAKRAYFSTAFGKLLGDFNDEVSGMVQRMNKALPEQVRQTIRDVVSGNEKAAE